MLLQQIHYTVELTKNNFSVSNTAIKLGVSQPTISLGVRKFESSIGAIVFIRRGKRIIGLTTSGKQIIKIAEDIVNSMHQINLIS